MQVNDLKAGRWTARQLSSKTLDPGDPGLSSVSCAAPHVCSAVLTVMNSSGDFSDWGFASRGAAGGWHFQLTPSHVPTDTPLPRAGRYPARSRAADLIRAATSARGGPPNPQVRQT